MYQIHHGEKIKTQQKGFVMKHRHFTLIGSRLKDLNSTNKGCYSARRQSKACFTLIELLVVIAIIAILAAILLPALNSARERGRTASCVSNYKTMSTGVLNYGNDFDDYTPSARNNDEVPGNWGLVNLAPYVGLPIGTNGWIGPGLGPETVYTCPSDPRDFLGEYETLTTAQKWGYHRKGRKGSVATNAVLMVNYGNAFRIKTTKLPSPTTTIFLIENTQYSVRHDGEGQSYTQLGFYHNDSINASYMDGHVATITKSAYDARDNSKFWNHGN